MPEKKTIGANEKYCSSCGAVILKEAEICPKCGVRQQSSSAVSAPDGRKSWLVALILSILAGSLGIDRFYLGYIGLGVLKLLTLGACGIWTIVDIVLIAIDKLPDADGNPLHKG